jgi:hypothetical protein
MFVKSIFVVVMVLGLTQASIIPTNEIQQALQLAGAPDASIKNEDLNVFLDEIFANLRYQMRQGNLTAIKFPEEIILFSETVMGVVYHGEILNGAVNEIDTFHRTGDCDFVVEDNGDIVLDVEVGLNDPSISGALRLKFQEQALNVAIIGALKEARLRLVARVRLDFDGGLKIRAQVDKFEIIHLGTVSVDLKGLGILTFLIKPIVNVVGNLVKSLVATLLEGVVKALLDSILQGLASRFPVDDFIKNAHMDNSFANAIPQALPERFEMS